MAKKYTCTLISKTVPADHKAFSTQPTSKAAAETFVLCECPRPVWWYKEGVLVKVEGEEIKQARYYQVKVDAVAELKRNYKEE
jgi:hypothetical protein